MTNIELVLPGLMRDDFVAEVRAQDLPVPLQSSSEGGELFAELSSRIMGALLSTIEYFDKLDHRRLNTAEPLRCAIYFTADPHVDVACKLIDNQHYVFISVDLVEQLVRCCDELGKVLVHRNEKSPDLPAIKREADLDVVLTNFTTLSDNERSALAERVKQWPSPGIGGGHDTPGIAEMTVLHDLLRIVVIHEIAHCVCGHVQFFAVQLGVPELPEFAESRYCEAIQAQLRAPQTHILQAIELHADEFSIHWSALQILVGYDPAGRMFENSVDLLDRLLLLDVAAGVFAIRWSLLDFFSDPGTTFHVRPTPLTEIDAYAEKGPDIILGTRTPFKVIRSSHPPAELRYYRHQNFVMELSQEHYGSQRLGVRLASHTRICLDRLIGHVSPQFYQLLKFKPMGFKTPDMRRLDSYEDYLMELSGRMSPLIHEFLPTRPLLPG